MGASPTHTHTHTHTYSHMHAEPTEGLRGLPRTVIKMGSSNSSAGESNTLKKRVCWFRVKGGQMKARRARAGGDSHRPASRSGPHNTWAVGSAQHSGLSPAPSSGDSTSRRLSPQGQGGWPAPRDDGDVKQGEPKAGVRAGTLSPVPQITYSGTDTALHPTLAPYAKTEWTARHLLCAPTKVLALTQGLPPRWRGGYFPCGSASAWSAQLQWPWPQAWCSLPAAGVPRSPGPWSESQEGAWAKKGEAIRHPPPRPRESGISGTTSQLASWDGY